MCYAEPRQRGISRQTLALISENFRMNLFLVAGMFGFQELGSLIFDLSQTVKAGNLVVAGELFIALDLYLSRLNKQ